MKITRKTFQSSSAFWEELQKPEVQRYCYDNKKWTGESLSNSLFFLRSGNTDLVPDAEKLLEQLTTAISLNRVDWQNDICGVIPDVPAFLSGVPENMRARVTQKTENAPIKVFVNVTSSAMYKFADLQKRGITILALILQLQKFRQVELYVYTSLGQYRGGSWVTLIKLQTSPMQISEVAYCLTSQAFARSLGYGYNNYMGSGGSWPEERDERILTQAGEHDLVVGPCDGMHNKNEASRMLKDPVTWINEKVAQFIKEVEA